jgi:hypothetical protein
MHIHGNSMNINPASFYSSGNAEAAANQRAGNVRKRLLKSAASLDGTVPDDEASLVNHWLNANPNQSGSDAEYHSASSGKDSDLA